MKIVVIEQSGQFNLWASFGRALESLGHDIVRLDPLGLPARRRLWRSRATRRLFEVSCLRGIEDELMGLVTQHSPDLIWVAKGHWALLSFWRRLRRQQPGALTVCYNPEDPITTFSRGSNRLWITGSTSAFDLFCTYKGGILGELTARGAREVLHLTFARNDLVPGDDPHDAGDGERDYDLLLVGIGDRPRETVLCNTHEHARSTDLRIGVYGNWGGVRSKLLRDVLAGRQVSFGVHASA